MNAPLTPRVEQLISERLARGSYRTAAELTEEAFNALIEREEFLSLSNELTRAEEQLANGEFNDTTRTRSKTWLKA